MQCSELFSTIFDSHCGGCVRTCACGRTYYDTYNTWDWDDEELEAFEQKAKDNPEDYIGVDHAIGTISIDGREIVDECTCEWAQRYEDFIVHHAEQIAEYLNKRAVILREEADAINVK